MDGFLSQQLDCKKLGNQKHMNFRAAKNYKLCTMHGALEGNHSYFFYEKLTNNLQRTLDEKLVKQSLHPSIIRLSN